MNNNIIKVFSICLFGLLVISQSDSFAENRTLTRNLEPVIVKGSQLPGFTGAAVNGIQNEIYFYAYDKTLKVWRMIPFQIDELDNNGNYVFDANGEGNGLDSNDELVCMAQDAGDHAGSDWLNDATAQNFKRYEVEIKNPIFPDQKAWIYIYRSTSLSLDETLVDYVEYVAPTNSNYAEDKINTLYYEIVNSKHGFPVDLRIWDTQGGPGSDLFDIMKFRAKANVSVLGSIDIKEDNITYKSADDVQIKDGLVRVIRKLKATIKKSFTFYTFETVFDLKPAYYYPYNIAFSVRIPTITSASISEGRISFDLNSSNMSGSRFLSANNAYPGYIVDGKDENPNENIDNVLPNYNWISLTGSKGTIIHYFPLEKSVGGNRNLYYFDNGSQGVLGDTGIIISGGIETPFEMAYTGYYLGPNMPFSTGSDIAAFESNPLLINSHEQDLGTVPVELVTFNATVNDNDVLLQWTTATETNNFGFEIESRFANESEWTTLELIHGRGTTTKPAKYEYVDVDLFPGTYEYRLKQIDLDGSSEYSHIISATVATPESFVLLQNYPNPFNPETTIGYELAESGHITLTIYNLLGQRVWTLVNEIQSAGRHEIKWNALNQNNIHVASNFYIYELKAGANVQRRKMVLVR